MKEVLKLVTSEWLLNSNIALGILRNVPISIKTKNSEEELITFFRGCGWIS